MENNVYSDILEKIDQVIKEKDQFEKSITDISQQGLNKSQVKAIRKLAKDREKTHRRMIRELRKIYDDQSGRTVRKSLLKTARISARNGEKVDFDKLIEEIKKTK